MVVKNVKIGDYVFNKSKYHDYHAGHLIYDYMTKNPNDICQIDAATDESETNASVLARSVRLAKCFRKLGLQPGDVLGLSGKNHMDVFIPYYAAMMTGLPIYALDYNTNVDTIKKFYKLTRPKITFCDHANYEDYVRAVTELKLDTKIVTFYKGDCTMGKFMDIYGDDGPVEEFEPTNFDTDKVYGWLVGTSGSTGSAKVAAIKHDVIIKKVNCLKNFFWRPNNPPFLNLSPAQWVSGYGCALTHIIMGCSRLQTSRPDDPGHVVELINKYKPKVVLMIPLFVQFLIHQSSNCDASCFDLVVITGCKVHKEVLEGMRQKLHKDALIAEGYGSTETITLAFLPDPKGPVGTCGKQTPDDEFMLVDEYGKEITEPNVAGELWIKGMTFTEYYKNPVLTAKAFSEDGHFKTGDLMYRDENGFYHFVDRLKLLMKYRQHHIFASELEKVIRNHKGVMDVCVNSIAHPIDREHPVACVVRYPGSNVTAQEIRDLVASELPDPKHLRGGVIFLDRLPYTTMGKLSLVLVAEIVSKMPREAADS